MDELEQHDCAWNDRLQDLLDADVRSTERAEIESHIATCPRCRLQYAKLKRLDAKLSAQIGAPRLDAAFDRQVFAKINALDARRREHAQRQAERELTENLQALARARRWGVVCLVSGVVAAVATIYAIMTWSENVDAAGQLFSFVTAIGLPQAGSLHTFFSFLIAAAIGGGVAKWIADTVG
ncbi:MAG TPA: zf-HC2 domain-containing protein [Steroidobacteraceae bacterium]